MRTECRNISHIYAKKIGYLHLAFHGQSYAMMVGQVTASSYMALHLGNFNSKALLQQSMYVCLCNIQFQGWKITCL